MDYYLIHGHDVLVEEFVRRNDFSTVGLRSSDSALSRLIRTDPALGVSPITREEAGGVALRDYDEFPSAPMLTLSASPPQAGFREKRLYRVLFARKPIEAQFGDLTEKGDSYSWQLRAVGNDVAWCLDVTAQLKQLNQAANLGPVLDRLTDQMRLCHGLIPVTTERFQ